MTEIRTLEAGKLLCLEDHGSREDINQAFNKIMTFVEEKKVPIKGERFAFFYDDSEQINHEQTHFAAAVELSGEVFGDGEIIVVTQAMMKVACQLHQGSLETISETYSGLKKWIQEQGYQVSGPIREYYLSSGSDEQSSQAMTEIQIPVIKRA